MPELPEVQTIVTMLAPRVQHRRIVAVCLARRDVLHPIDTDLPALLVGRRIGEICRRGKRIIFTLDDSRRFFVHLGMSGRLMVQPPVDPLLPHTHLTLDLQASSAPKQPVEQLRFRDPRRFGGIWWMGQACCDNGMGPEPLTVRPRQLANLLARTTRAIKNAMLDQSVLAGLGNIYVDESLFAAGIHPLTPANALDGQQIRALNRAIKATLRRALRHRGSTLRDYRDADGAAGNFQKLHRVYARGGAPCPVCKRPVERIVLGGRSTHFCPNCQPFTVG